MAFIPDPPPSSPDAEQPTLSIVIPVYNEEESLPTLFERLNALCAPLANTSHEVVFIDDHSADGSSTLLAEACRANPRFRFLRLARNSGSHVAILAGLQHARGQCAVFLAADLQDPPELVPQMLDLWRQGNHVVWAVRGAREGIPFSERLFAKLFYATFNKVAQVSLPPQGTDFALLDRAVLDALNQSVNASPFLMGEIAQIGFRQTHIEYVKAERKFGHTKWNLRKKLHLFADAFVACSYFPLRAMSYLGITFSIFGFLYAALVIILRLTNGIAVEGWAFLAVAVLVLGGVQMIMLGVLGEYLWRTLEEARRRPAYFIEASSGMEPTASHEATVKADPRVVTKADVPERDLSLGKDGPPSRFIATPPAESETPVSK